MDKLTKEEQDTYYKVLEHGTMEMMFELGYIIGRARVAEEQLDYLNKK